MKYLIVLLVVLVGAWVWRMNRRAERAQDKPSQTSVGKPGEAPQDMVRCAHCGLHLPRSEAIPGGEKAAVQLYCSAEHRASAGSS